MHMHFCDDIFYVVKACIAMHNRMVEMCVGEEHEESSSFYKVVQYQPSKVYIDSVKVDVDMEVSYLLSQDEAGGWDFNNNLGDLNLWDQIDMSKFYSQYFRVM